MPPRCSRSRRTDPSTRWGSTQPWGLSCSSTTRTQDAPRARTWSARGPDRHRRLGRQRQLAAAEAQRAVAAVPSDEVGDEVVGRLGEQLGGRRELGELAADAQDGDLVAELDRLVDVVGDEDDGLAELALQAQELVLELLAHDRVDGAERLVHEHDRRVGRERAGDADALLLAAGELRRVAPRHRGVEADPLHELHRAVAGLLLVPAEQQRHRRDVVDDGAVREQAGVLDDVADAAAQRGRVGLRGVLAVDEDPTRGQVDHPVDHPQRRRLAAPGGSDEHRDLPRRGCEREPTHGGGAVGVGLGHGVELDHPPSSGSVPLVGHASVDPRRARRHWRVSSSRRSDP